MLGPFVLRRLKSDVATQLTAKVQKVETVSMTDAQAELYTAAVQELRAQVAASGKGVLQTVQEQQLGKLGLTLFSLTHVRQPHEGNLGNI